MDRVTQHEGVTNSERHRLRSQIVVERSGRISGESARHSECWSINSQVVTPRQYGERITGNKAADLIGHVTVLPIDRVVWVVPEESVIPIVQLGDAEEQLSVLKLLD